MEPSENAREENLRLRRTMRDLVALSTLPAVWMGLGPEGIARSLADVLLNTLSLDLIYIRLTGLSGEGVVEVVRSKHRNDTAQVEVVKAALAPLLGSDRTESPANITDPFGTGKLRVAVTRFGVGHEHGVLVTGSRNADFPTERDRLLLGVGANQTAIVIQRRQAEEQVHEQRERLLVTLASIGDAVLTTDAEGRVTFLNPVAEALTGWTHDEAMGRPLEVIFEIINGETRGPVENPVSKVLRDGKVVGLANHTVLIAKDGTKRPIDDSAAPIRGKEGEIVGCVLVFRDITERKREEIAQAERGRLTALRADVSTALSSEHATPTALQHCCEAFVRHLDVAFARIWTLDDTNTTLELQASAGLYTHLNGPHSRVPVGQFKIGRIASTRQPHLTNAVPEDPNISDREWAVQEGMVAFAGYPLLVEGRVVGVVAMFARQALTEGILTDLAPLTEGIAQYIQRKEMEERFRRQAELHRVTLASIGDGLITIDAEGRTTFLNSVAQRLTGWTLGEAMGKPLEEIFRIVHENTRKPVENPALRALREGTTVGLANHTILLAKDGSEWPLDDSAAPIRDEGGTVNGAVLVFREVTERRAQERELQQREQQFRTLADSIPQLAWMAHPDGHIFWYNRRWYEYTGTTFEQMEGWGWQSVHDPEELPKVLEQWQASLATGEALDIVFPLKGKDGVFRPFLTRVMPVKDDKGQVARWFGTNTDVSEAKRIEEELRDARSRLDSTLEAAEIGTCVYDVVRNTVQADKNLARMFGVTGEEANNGPLAVYQERIHPDDWKGLTEIIERALASGERYESEHRVVRASGEVRWVVARGWVERDGEGKAVRLPGVVVDITERKLAEAQLRESEERFRVLFETMTEGFAIDEIIFNDAGRGCDLRYLEVNPAFERHTGLRRSDILGRTTLELFPDAEPVWFERYGQVATTGVATHFQEKFGPLERWFEVSAYRTGANQIAVVFFDITEQKRAEESLREADRRKDEFLATLAHELRNPLAPIRNGLQVLKLSPERQAREQVQTMMERQLSQLVRLVDDLMDLSRISRGKIELRKERVELAAVVRSAVETSRPLIEQMGHELTVTLPRFPVAVDADFTRLAQVFLNLLNNAAKYTERGGRIWLTAERQGSDVVVSVKDNGIGIAPNQLPLLFEMFSQLDCSLEKAQGGLGIGLTLVKRLLEMHGGRIEAKSKGAGMGSEFVVRLPVVVDASRSHASIKEESAALKSSLRILVVDDNRDGADSLSMMLKIMGNNTRTAYDGEESVAVAVDFQPDVILLDLGLPKLSGYEACRRIRQQPGGQQLLIIAQTGWGQEEDRQRTHEAGFDHHMVKPVDPQALMKLLSELQAAKA